MRITRIPGGVTAPHEFVAAGISAGIKRSGRPDLALVVSEAPATAAAVFTRNRITAAPVQLSRARIRRGSARAVLINSGCANCLTGAAGRRDARRLGAAAARALGLLERDVLLASTGLIGTRLPAARIARAVPELVQRLGRRGHRAAATAILTTDRMPKEMSVSVSVQGRSFRIGGMAKGAGMIAPSMATMLCVVTSDARIPAALLRRLLRQATEETFNRITVDGDMSTNDTVFALANGASGVVIEPGTVFERAFAAGLRAVAEQLALRIVRDGEGATRLLTVQVTGGRTAGEAQACARAVALSPLVKTMLAGADPNLGRVAGAVGASGARFDPRRLEIWLGHRRAVARETVVLPNAAGRRLLRRRAVTLRVDLRAGSGTGRMWTCDLTTSYVRINAGYAT